MVAKKKPSARSSTATSVKKKPVKVKAVAKRAGAAKKPAVRSTQARPTQTTSKAMPAMTHDQIAKRAYELWLASGRPIGRDQAIWLQAECELNKRKD